MLSYFMADETASIFEPPVKNSGIGGGRCAHALPPRDLPPSRALRRQGFQGWRHPTSSCRSLGLARGRLRVYYLVKLICCRVRVRDRRMCPVALRVACPEPCIPGPCIVKPYEPPAPGAPQVPGPDARGLAAGAGCLKPYSATPKPFIPRAADTWTGRARTGDDAGCPHVKSTTP